MTVQCVCVCVLYQQQTTAVHTGARSGTRILALSMLCGLVTLVTETRRGLAARGGRPALRPKSAGAAPAARGFLFLNAGRRRPHRTGPCPWYHRLRGRGPPVDVLRGRAWSFSFSSMLRHSGLGHASGKDFGFLFNRIYKDIYCCSCIKKYLYRPTVHERGIYFYGDALQKRNDSRFRHFEN